MQDLTLHNVSSLPLTVTLDLKHPFAMLFGEDSTKTSSGSVCTEATFTLDVNESYILKLQFDPAYKDDFHIRTADEVLTISYAEHPHIVSVHKLHIFLTFLVLTIVYIKIFSSGLYISAWRGLFPKSVFREDYY